MNKRLFWNFELATASKSAFTDLPTEPASLLRWEKRYFWPEDTIISVSGLAADCFNLSVYDIKEREDNYYLLADHHLNIKQRRDELLYKPLIEQIDNCLGFAKKINLSTQAPFHELPGTKAWQTGYLLDMIDQQSKLILVKKIALIYKLNTYPKIKLEFARLLVADKLFFSLCIEGRSQTMVNTISRRLLISQPASDYIHFLKEITL